MMGGDDDSSKTSNAPRDTDVVTMRNGDVLAGVVDFNLIRIKTSYLPEMSIDKKDIDSIEFAVESDTAKVRTKGGDTIRGKIFLNTFALVDSSLPEAPVLKRDDIRIIHCR
jgi:hypothetical protein